MGCNSKNSFVELVKKVYDIKDEVMLVVSINDELRAVARIDNDIAALVPYTDDIETVSNNIKAVRDAYDNARIATSKAKEASDSAYSSKESSEISKRAKDIALDKAREADGSANASMLSAEFADVQRAKTVEVFEELQGYIDPVVDNMKLLLLAPEYAQKSKEYSEISERAKNIALDKAREANDNANASMLSAEFADVQRAKTSNIYNDFLKKEVEIVGVIDEYKHFVSLSKEQINNLGDVLKQRANEVESARLVALDSARSAIDAQKQVKLLQNETSNNESKAKSYRDESQRVANEATRKLNAIANVGVEVAKANSEVQEAKDEVAEMYGHLKLDDSSAVELKKEMYATRTGTLYEMRGDLLR